MPKNISSGLQADFAGEDCAVAMCIRVIRTDGTQIGFTSWDSPFSFAMITNPDSHGSILYNPGGFVPTDLKSTATTAPDNLEVQGAIDSNLILDKDLYGGLYDNAQITFFKVNPNNLAHGEEICKIGYVGTIGRTDGKWTFEILSLIGRMKFNIVQVASPLCRVQKFCNNQCKLVEADYTHVGVLAADMNPSDYVIQTTLTSLPPTTVYGASIKLNCGGGASSPFAADQYYDSGTYVNTTGTAIDTTGLVNPAPQAVYKSLRGMSVSSWGTTFGSGFGNDGTWSYRIIGLTPSVSHTVRLHFSDNIGGSVGYFVTDIDINNVGVDTYVDIYAIAGAMFKGVIKEYTVDSDPSGTIKITLIPHNSNGSIINGIELLPASASSVDLFANGLLTINGVSRKIRSATIIGMNVTFTVNESFGFSKASGYAVSSVEGCDRSPQQCKMRGNILNFRGEPFLPGNPVIMQQGRHN